MCIYYIAYGSNLNIRQMKYRCPTAKVIGKTSLDGWRLRFRGTPHNAVATIEQAEGYSVPVGVWKIGKEDEASLDIYEGYPRLYRKETMTITLEDKPIEAMIYIMNENYPYNDPCYDYLCAIRDGYTVFDMDKAILREAVSTAKEVQRHDRKG